MKNHPPLQVFGYLTSCDLAATNLTPVGLQSLLLGSPGKPYAQSIDRAGNVAAFLPMPPLAPVEFVSAPLPIVPQIGLPSLCGFVPDPTRPSEMEVMYWADMAALVAQSYPAMQAAYKKYPVAGFRAANFLLAEVPGYDSTENGPASQRMQRHTPEIEQLAADDAHIYRRSDEVKELAAKAGIKIEDERGPTPRP